MPRHRVQNGGSLRAFSLPFTFLECHASDDVAPVPAVARCGVTEVAVDEVLAEAADGCLAAGRSRLHLVRIEER